MVQIDTLNQDSYGYINHKLDIMIGNREHGQLVQIDRANQPIPVEDAIRHVVGRTEQVSVGTAVTLIAGANPWRKSIKITNVTGTQLIYLGFSNAVSATTGDYLHSAAGSNTTLAVQGQIWGIAVTGAQTISLMEEEYEH